MEKRTCIIFGAGDFLARPFQKPAGSLLIAADGGYAHMKACGLEPDLLIGDFDSLPTMPVHPHVVRLKKEKDDTDMLAAIRWGLAEGCEIFQIYGGTGGRMDHTFANLQCLAWLAQQNTQGFLHDASNVITAIHNTSMCFDESFSGTISVFAYSGTAKGVSEEGLAYALDNVELSDTFPLGVSNAFTGKKSRVSVREGTLLLFYATD